jgi:hypothetical protein
MRTLTGKADVARRRVHDIVELEGAKVPTASTLGHRCGTARHGVVVLRFFLVRSLIAAGTPLGSKC